MRREDPNQLLRNIGLRLAELRGGRGWSREDLAERLGVSVRYLARLEAGKQNLTVYRLVWLAGHVGVRVVDLFAAAGIEKIAVGRPSARKPERR